MQLLKAPIDHCCWWAFKLLTWSMSQRCGTHGLISDSNINSPCKCAGQQLTPKMLCYVPIPEQNAHTLLLDPLDTVFRRETILEFQFIFMSQTV